MSAPTPAADSKPKRQRSPRKAATYRAARRNRDRFNGGLSRRASAAALPGPQTAKHYKQTREAARRLRQIARRAS